MNLLIRLLRRLPIRYQLRISGLLLRAGSWMATADEDVNAVYGGQGGGEHMPAAECPGCNCAVMRMPPCGHCESGCMCRRCADCGARLEEDCRCQRQQAVRECVRCGGGGVLGGEICARCATEATTGPAAPPAPGTAICPVCRGSLGRHWISIHRRADGSWLLETFHPAVESVVETELRRRTVRPAHVIVDVYPDFGSAVRIYFDRIKNQKMAGRVDDVGVLNYINHWAGS